MLPADAIARQFAFAAEVHTTLLCFGDAIHLPFAPYVILKFSNKRQNAHY
jgi:hypothetical protein